MAMAEERSPESSSNPHFFKIILPHTIQTGSLRIPPAFVKKHGRCLPDCACLEVSTGVLWKVELKRRDNCVWFHKGWQDFVDYYSIKSGYFLVFRYDGGSFFHVFIFDPSTSEIEYPASVASTSHKVELDQPKITDIEDADADDEYGDEIPDERPRKQHKSEKVMLRKQSGTSGGDKVIDDIGGATSSASDRVCWRAGAFRSPNPYFIINIQRYHLFTRGHLEVPSVHARRYYLQNENKIISLHGGDGRTWVLQYFVGNPPQCRVRAYAGWRKFMQDNHLKVGDACAFELVSKTPKAYKVTLFRKSDGENLDRKVLPKNIVLEKAVAFKGTSPRFEIHMRQTHISCPSVVDIPMDHAKEYLMNDDQGESVVLCGSEGRTWRVRFMTGNSSRKYARFGSGWRDFLLDNRPQVGDVCVFEMIASKPSTYKVTVIHKADGTRVRV